MNQIEVVNEATRYLDLPIPMPEKGEKMCGACGKIAITSKTDNGWMYFGFKHLQNTWVCDTCLPEKFEHMISLQEGDIKNGTITQLNFGEGFFNAD